ncbi:hypothetical protein [Candidatus Stoquefichus sp. SB1]|nr:hypothetical protein [Candidatus Stoquefichus sp. SB1]
MNRKLKIYKLKASYHDSLESVLKYSINMIESIKKQKNHFRG